MTDLVKQCVTYFRSNKVWDRILKAFWNKYRSYGEFSGTVVLQNLWEEEIETLEGFFAKNFHGRKSIRITAAQFRKSLSESRFSEVAPEQLLELYFGKELLSKEDERSAKEERREQILEKLRLAYRETTAEAYFLDMVALPQLRKTSDDVAWEKLLRMGAEIMNHLPYQKGQYMYLAVFATQITGNPHAFDQNGQWGSYLFHLIQLVLIKRQELPRKSGDFPALYRKQCFLNVGILLDDISNYALLYGIRATRRNGREHAGTAGFFAEREIMQIPLIVLAGLKQMECVNKRIYIVENPSVFAALCASGENISCMCMNGQPRLASLVTLNLLAASGTEVYYAGDLDPEGMLIAQKIAHYYKGTFHYWHMEVADYEKSMSQEVISERRIKSLGHIIDEELLPVVERMREVRVAGYQERILHVGKRSAEDV